VALQYDTNGNITTGTAFLRRISIAVTAIAGMTLSPDSTRLIPLLGDWHALDHLGGTALGVAQPAVADGLLY
jgi:hypothetical protein